MRSSFVKQNSDDRARRLRKDVSALARSTFDVADASARRPSRRPARPPRPASALARSPPDLPPLRVARLATTVRPASRARCFLLVLLALSAFRWPARGSPLYSVVSSGQADNSGTVMATAPHSFAALPRLSPAVADWVESVRQLTTPDRVQWCDGSPAELARLKQGAREIRRAQAAQPDDVSGLSHRLFAPVRRRARRAPDIHLHEEQAKTRALTTTGWIPPRRTPRCGSCSRAA